MKVSTQTIKFINDLYKSAGDPAPKGIDELTRIIGAQLAAVEEVIDFGSRFNEVVIVKVVSCEDHSNADRLHICKIDDGGKTKDVERDDKGLVQVVCGAPNVHAGMLAAWLPPGSTVPSTVGAEPFVLEARDIRGQKSNGMLASPKELSLSDNHEGILEVTEDFGPVAPGTMFVDQYHLRDDYIIDMENKMFTHRPDLFGTLGIARELAGIQHQPYKSPDWYRIDPEIPGPEAEELPFEVRNELSELVPRFTAIVLRDVKVGPSPVWLQVDLARSGIKSINNIVDYTNCFMMETGQPLHAYDYDKVKERSQGDKATIVVRHPKQGEKVRLLGGKEIEPRKEAIIIATDKEPIGVGGVMGGADTEVGENTKNVIIECANFDMYSIRRTAMAHGLFTEAVTRFNKGQSPLQNLATVGIIVEEIRKFAGGKVASPLIDDNHVPKDVMERGSIHPPVTVSREFINARLGFDLSADEMAQLLKNVEFDVNADGENLTVKAPFWRTDIEIPEDVVEEIGRLYGYDHLPLQLPRRDLTPAPKDVLLEIKKHVRSVLSAAGANEVLTYSFVHGELLDKVANALSPDLQYFRLSLMPSLLEKVHPNIKSGYDEFALFEINKVHGKSEKEADGLPAEFSRIALVFAANDKTASATYAGAPFYQARKYLTDLLASIDLNNVRFEPLTKIELRDHRMIQQMFAAFEPNRSAALLHGEHVVGVIGEYRASVSRALKLPNFSAGFELFARTLVGTGTPYVQQPRFPKVEQDICLKVPADTSYEEVFQFVWDHLKEHRPDATYHTLGPVDIYQRKDDPTHKQITLRLSLASFDRTLTDQEVAKLLDHVAEAAKEQLHADRV
jgi:phenylalanyl-tRNA synthetase beta chain